MAARPENILGVAKEAKVSVNVVLALVDTAERAGIPRRRFFEVTQIDPHLLEAPDGQLPRSDLYQMCERLLDISADPSLGLRWGDAVPDRALSVLQHLVTYSTTLRQAFETLFRFSKLLTDEPGIRLIERADRVTVRCLKPSGASLRVQRFVAEMTLAGIYRMICSYHSAARVERVCFEHAAPPYRAAYTRMFETAECFEQPFTGIVFDRALMNAVSPHKDEDLHGALRTLAERRLMSVTNTTPYAVRVREVLMHEPAPHRVAMKHVARKLDISVRSLHRRLSDEGKSYTDVATEASAATAVRMIADERQTIQQTAYSMGFSDVSSFHRAFKRWTGTTPRAYRERATTHHHAAEHEPLAAVGQ